MAKTKNAEKESMRSIQNRRARFDYAFDETHEAGVMLMGSEVKSIVAGRAHLTDAYCRVENDELWLVGFDIEPYENAVNYTHERRRDRKLLMHRREIDTIERKSKEKGFTIVPLQIYFKNGKVKVEIGLGRGKSNYDKRDSIAKDDTRREVERLRSEKF